MDVLLVVAGNVVAPHDGVLTPCVVYWDAESWIERLWFNRACGIGIGELGGSFSAGAGLFALGLVDG